MDIKPVLIGQDSSRCESSKVNDTDYMVRMVNASDEPNQQNDLNDLNVLNHSNDLNQEEA